ncbi:uL11 family ribosomal protein [Candidatus Vidania fulgoroideorum]
MIPIAHIVKTQIKLQQAKPNANLGAVIGSKGINVTHFCNEFNKITKFPKGALHPVIITIYKDKTFKITVKQKTTSTLIKEVLPITHTSFISNNLLKQVALRKLKDLNTKCIKKAIQIIKGCAKSMGLTPN